MSKFSFLPRQRFSAVVRSAAACAMLASTLAAVPAIAADNWPNGPLTVIAPFSPGGGGDTLVRLYGHQLSGVLNTTVIVENKPGAGGNIGTAVASRAEANGNTLVYGTNGTMGTNHALYRQPGYTLDDFDPIALFGKISLVFTVSSDSPFNSVNDIVTHAKANPGMLTCASGGNGTTSHLACAMFQKLAGIDVQHVPYRASAAALVDMVSDRITFLIDVMPFLKPQIDDGKVRALAVTMKERVPGLPNVPSMEEAGVPGYELFAWDGLFAPKGTPAPRLDKLHAAVEAALRNPEFSKTMTERGTILEPMPRSDFAAFVKAEHQRMGALAGDLGIRID